MLESHTARLISRKMADKNLHIPSFMTKPGMGSMAAPARKPTTQIEPKPALRPIVPDQPLPQIRVETLAGLTKGAPWLLEQLHVRTHHILLWTTRGQGRVLLHGLRRGFGAHNAIFVPAGKLLAFELGLQVQGLAMLIPDDGRVTLPDRAQHLRLQDGTEQAEFTAILDALRRELHDQRPFMAEALNAHARLLSVALRRDLQEAGPPPPTRASERIVRRFCDILAAEYTNGHPMAWYADQLDITPTHLTRVCRQAAGLTAAEMLSQMTQHRARSLLLDSDLPINRVADSLGFGSAAYFTRFCQQHFGAAPSQVRKQARA